MIGNDVVDLQLAAQESNWRREGFLQKVFSTPEQEIIATSSNPHTIVWLLWSMKEAAYKAHQREFNLQRRLNWLVQSCRLKEITSGNASGEVNIEGEVYFTTSEVTLAFIHTSAEREKNSDVEKGTFEAPSSEVKRRVLNQVSKHFSVDTARLKIQKDAFGMPFLSLDNTFFFDRFSFSGHGRYSAYILSLINCETSVKHS